ncbi:rho GTPase-activating protein 3-like [Rutidosis leptorrhynchoides]|uniref:rho GTPase-activating protein 3-like n=1 Tax=Rutidosis leptorrhynchoides TaxID=125765 RepID=UPI003A99680D
MTTLFRSKSCGGPPPPKASFFHYSSQYHDHDHEPHDHDHGDDNYYFCQDYSYLNNNNDNDSPIKTPFISPCQQPPSNSTYNFTIVSHFLTTLRKSILSCTIDHDSEQVSTCLDIGCPTDVRHVSHVTFDRFNGFVGLPISFQPEVPRKVPSASVCVFGVSVESMQCSYDERGNSVPTILLMIQNRLYAGGGLQTEGIFRINGENGQDEDVRKQLNRGVVAHGVDVHCLAGLIKAWFRELPTGVLDSLTSEQVMHCNTENECTRLANSLPPTEASLLDWAINLMADVVTYDQINKMNARNIAMVFAPNMTQMADPLTALIHAVQIMNLLKTLVIKTLREREDSSPGFEPASSSEDYPSPNKKIEYPCIVRSATLNRLGSENEEQFWSFPRKSGSVAEYDDYMSSKSPPVTYRSDQLECNDQSKHANNEGTLEKLSFRKGVRRICKYSVFQLRKPSKKNENLIVETRSGSESWA